MVFNSPLASAGFSRLAASPPPSLPPAPISVCASSIKSIVKTVLDLISLMTAWSLLSNSPFTLAPACKAPRSSESNLAP